MTTVSVPFWSYYRATNLELASTKSTEDQLDYSPELLHSCLFLEKYFASTGIRIRDPIIGSWFSMTLYALSYGSYMN